MKYLVFKFVSLRVGWGGGGGGGDLWWMNNFGNSLQNVMNQKS